MQISSAASAGYPYAGSAGGANQDQLIQSIQKQIEDVQKQLRSLSENKELSLEEKMEKRKLLQQQIQDLNQQIAQRRIEIQQERLAAAKAAQEQAAPKSTTTEDQTLKTDSMMAIVRADTAIKQTSTLHKATTSLQGQARVLENQIKADKGRGDSVDKKEAKLAVLNERIDAASKTMAAKVSDLNAEHQAGGAENTTQRDDETLTAWEQAPDSDPIVYTKDGTVVHSAQDGAFSSLA